MQAIHLGSPNITDRIKIPFFQDRVPAGFPSPATDYCEKSLDLNDLCIKKPAATYFVRAQGESMVEAGIFHDDILVVDRSLTASHGDIVIAEFNGELTVKQLELKPEVRLVPRNNRYRPILIPEEAELEIFGVVTTVIHSVRNR